MIIVSSLRQQCKHSPSTAVRIEIAKFQNKAQSKADLIILSDSSEEIEKANDKKLSISQSLDKKVSH